MGKFEIKYLQRKLRAGREFFYFRVVKPEGEFRRPLPHPTADEFGGRYNAAWFECFGVFPDDLLPSNSIARLCAEHMASQAVSRLPRNSYRCRERACEILTERWGQFDAGAIKTPHCQKLYDSFARKPASANRLADDMSALFSWSIPRGFCEVNPWRHIERLEGGEGYEPWAMKPLIHLIANGRERVVWVALAALYTGQDRGDVLAMCDAEIEGEHWERRRNKTRRRKGRAAIISVTLHPVVMAVIEACREIKRQAGIVDPARPLLVSGTDEPWTPNGFNSSWRRELKRLGLSGQEPRLTFKGLRTTNATLIAEAAAQGSDSAAQAMERVKAMLGHHSTAMSAHYARRAQMRKSNEESAGLLPDFGNIAPIFGNRNSADDG